MLNKNIPLLFVLGVIVLLASCAKEGPTGPTGNTGPTLQGTISGHVKLYDKYGVSVDTGLKTANLYFNGSSVAKQPDATGYYLVDSFNGIHLTTGNYSLTAADSGYGTTTKYVQLVTGNFNLDVKMSAIPDSFVYSFNAYYNMGSTGDSLVMTFKPDTRSRNCIVFANSGATVSGQPGFYLWSQIVSIPPNTSSVTYVVPGQDLTEAGMKSGNRVYYAVYNYVVGDASVYEDFGSGKMVYNAVSYPHEDTTNVP